MERYIKANRLVVEHLHLQGDRTELQDSNFLLWLQDLMVFGPLFNLAAICSQIGAIALTGQEARQEQEGTSCQQLPVATDQRFVISSTNKSEEGES